jgi:NAD-dependent SIR2 family protein deacetylase
MSDDHCPTEKYLRYKTHRDTVFVLGAGTSHPDGVPLQEHILPMIMSGEINEIAESEIGKQFSRFIFDNFFISEKQDSFPTLEAIFGFLDYFIQQNESLSAQYTNEEIREIKESFIKLIHYIIDLRTNNPSQIYHFLWEAVLKHNSNVSIITLNYDTLLEQAFDFLFPLHGYIDYCIPLMNYICLTQLKDYNFWVNPREPILLQVGENPVPFKIIKLHGSLNWKYCNCCNQTLLTPWDRKIDLNRGKFIGHTFPDEEEYDYYCPLDGTEFQTLIIPPSFIKSIGNPIISQLFSEASREIRLAKRIIFIGYSLSDADVHVKALFKKHLMKQAEVVVVNIKHPEQLMKTYGALSKNIRFITSSFEDMVQNEKLMAELLS